jgi:hypothetical protein
VENSYRPSGFGLLSDFGFRISGFGFNQPSICSFIYYMPKAEISWKRVTEEGDKLQVYAQHIGREWKFFHRAKRFDVWQPVKTPPLEDWLELLDSVQRLITRRRYQPDDEVLLRRTIRERFPGTKV